MEILVVGGAGYIGSHMVQELLHQGHKPIVLDNFSTGFKKLLLDTPYYEGCLSNTLLLDKIFTENNIQAVMHFAAFSQVAESCTAPDKYYENNVAKTIVLLNKILQYQIPNFIFSSTAAIFGNPEYTPIDEAHPKNPINPYGKSKLMIESVLEDYHNVFNLNYSCLRYFNAAGADPAANIGECNEPQTHLIPIVLDVALGKRESLTINGNDYATPDGTCIRDYIHVCDLVSAHLLALDFIHKHKTALNFNLGNGRGYSVKEIVACAEQITGKPINFTVGPRRPGDPPILIANSALAQNTLGWTPKFSALNDIIAHAWAWSQKHH